MYGRLFDFQLLRSQMQTVCQVSAVAYDNVVCSFNCLLYELNFVYYWYITEMQISFE